MDYIYESIEKMDLFEQILRSENPDYHVYVYWVSNGEVIKPSILTNISPFRNLEMYLQKEYGEQTYKIMIRYKKEMVLTGIISIGVPLNFTPRLDIRLEIESLREKELNRKRKRLRNRNVNQNQFAN